MKLNMINSLSKNRIPFDKKNQFSGSKIVLYKKTIYHIISYFFLCYINKDFLHSIYFLTHFKLNKYGF